MSEKENSSLTLEEWRDLAIESRDQLIRAIKHFKLQGSGNFISYDDEGNCKVENWREMFADTLEKFPGVKIDREALHYASWDQKTRRAFDKKRASRASAESKTEAA